MCDYDIITIKINQENFVDKIDKKIKIILKKVLTKGEKGSIIFKSASKGPLAQLVRATGS